MSPTRRGGLILESCLYEGWVTHRRSHPVEHAFAFPLFMVYLDLSELDEVFRGRWLWSTRRWALARFCREDHLGDPRQPLDAAVRDLVEQRSGVRPKGPIRLLTHLRYLGYGFNPVSLYYCWSPDGGCVEALVAEVTNVPWKERHCYVLRPGPAQSEATLRFQIAKEFHVSPFLGMDLDYRWSVGPPGRHLAVRIETLERGGSRCFDASLALERRTIDGASLARVLIRYPLLTIRMIAAIYWEALRLRRKGAPVYDHPGAHPDEHSSRLKVAS